MRMPVHNWLLLYAASCLLIVSCSKGDATPAQPLSSEKKLNGVIFKMVDNPSLQEDIIGILIGDSMKVKFPSGISLSNLVPTLDFSGASITPANRTPQNFTNPITYKITAQDGSANNYSFNSSYRILGDTVAMITTKWGIIKDSVANVNNYGFPNGCGMPIPGVYFGVPNDYWDFNSNGTVYISGNNNFVSGAYQIFPNGRLSFTDCFNYEGSILYLSSTRLTLFWTFSSSNGGQYTRISYLKK